MSNIQKRSSLRKWLIDGKVYFINPAFQTRFMVSVLLCVFLSLAVIFLSQQYFFHLFIQRGIALGLPDDHVFFALLKEQQIEMLQIFLVSSVILSAIICIWALFYSHRIAGPLYRLHRYFSDGADVKSNEIHPLSFRETDFFQELPKSINTFLVAHNHLDQDKIKK